MITAIIVVLILVAATLIVVNPWGGEEKEKVELAATISPASVELNAGQRTTLTINVTKNDEAIATDDPGLLKYRWTVSNTALGSFDVIAQKQTRFTASTIEGVGTISCNVSYTLDPNTPDEKVYYVVPVPAVSLTVLGPGIDSLIIAPNYKTLAPAESHTFTATVINTVNQILLDADISWSVSGMTAGDYTLSATTGRTVQFTANAEGTAALTATSTVEGDTKNGTATIVVTTIPSIRTVDYYWYDMFNVPFGEWWDLRAEVYGEDVPWTDEYPYIFKWYGSLEGNIWYYSMPRLNITGNNVPEINMNERPEFLPLLGIARGGTAQIDWYMQYLTLADMGRYPANTEAWADGWVVSLNGTVTLDKTAAMAVLNVTSSGWDDFDNWWDLNGYLVETQFSSWMTRESGKYRVDIYNAYEYPLTILTWEMTAERVDDKVVLGYDLVTWGIEVLMTRWMHESFMPTEWYFEDMTFRATIGPEMAELDIDTAVNYAMYAYEDSLGSDPCWCWESLLQDYIPSTPSHPKSDFDKYIGKQYENFGPGSWWYGAWMDYDYAPGAWNLSDGETLKFVWPADEVLFLKHVENDPLDNRDNSVANVTGEMTVMYAEPIEVDFPGQIVVDNDQNEITYTGPMDLWTWSKTQTTYDLLMTDWVRLGALPYGIPFIEFRIAGPTVPTSLSVEVLTDPVVSGEPADVQVTALDQYGDVFTDYNGTVTFYSNDTSATLPLNYTYVAGDLGVKTFTVTFSAQGEYNLTAWQVNDSSITGTAYLSVGAGRDFTYLRIDSAPAYAVSGAPFSLTVSALDQYSAVLPSYEGIVTFSSNDSDAGVVLPLDYTFIAATDAGVHAFTDEFTLMTSGIMAITVADTVQTTIDDTVDLRVYSEQPVTSYLMITAAPTDVTSESSFSLTVSAYNQFDEVWSEYTGTVTFATNDSDVGVVLAPDYAFKVADAGVHVFANNFTLVTEGVMSIGVNDSADPLILGDSVDITVLPKPTVKEITHRIYDLFQEPWGGWWYKRFATYGTDIVVGNEPGMSTMLYLPLRVGYTYQGMFYAPYRYALDAKNVTTLDVDVPEFLPSAEYLRTDPNSYLTNAGNITPGAEATVEVYFQYMTYAWWSNWWIPTWTGTFGFRNSLFTNVSDDGWWLGTIYNITMNRAAAEEWLGLNQSEADPVTWWAGVSLDYTATFEDWIGNEGNNRVDIYNAYEAIYAYIWTGAHLTVNPTSGDIEIQMGHLNWGGYEALMTRWLTDVDITGHQPYFEDFSMTASYKRGSTNLTMDAVCQYSMAAVRANGTASSPSWVWQPSRIDYINNAAHPSDWALYENLNYTSWNCGDTFYGQNVPYENTPQWMNLSMGETLIVEMPKGNVPGFRGQALTVRDYNIISNSWENYTQGLGGLEYSAIWAMTANGTAGLEPGYMVTNYPTNSIVPVYDAVANKLTFDGPLNFDNLRHSPNGPLYHSAPWIEMDVSGVTVLSVPEPGAPSTGAIVTSELVSLAVVVAAAMVAVVALGVACRRRY